MITKTMKKLTKVEQIHFNNIGNTSSHIHTLI